MPMKGRTLVNDDQRQPWLVMMKGTAGELQNMDVAIR
jgi:hypothetical protein